MNSLQATSYPQMIQRLAFSEVTTKQSEREPLR